MFPGPGSGRSTWFRTLPIAFVLAVLVVAVLPFAGAQPAAPASTPSSPGHAVVAAPAVPVSSGGGPRTAGPSPTVSPATVPSTKLQFYGNTTGFAVPTFNLSACQVY